jgi:hypothetical protein
MPAFQDKAYIGETPVLVSLREELEGLMGDDVVVEIERQLRAKD